MSLLARCLASLVCVILGVWQTHSYAINIIDISIGSWITEQLNAKDFSSKLVLTADGIKVTGQASQISLPPPFNELRNVAFTCISMQWQSNSFACSNGSLKFQHAELGQQNLNFSLMAKPEQAIFKIDIKRLRVAEGEAILEVNHTATHWTTSLAFESLSLSSLSSLMRPFVDKELNELLSSWHYEGSVSGAVNLEGTNSNIDTFDSNLQWQDVTFSNDSGTQVGEQLSAYSVLELKQSEQDWQWGLQIEVSEGQSYNQPIFLDYANTPIRLNSSGLWSPVKQYIDVNVFQFEQKNVLKVNATATFEEQHLSNLDLTLNPAELSELYPIWLQPVLVGTAVDKLDINGEISAQLELRDNQQFLKFSFDNVALKDQRKKFSLSGLTGIVGWSTGEREIESDFSWQQALLYKAEIGATDIKALSQNSVFRLTDEVNIPVLDGHLFLESFQLNHNKKDEVTWSFNGLLTPISMESLSSAFDWPVLHGKMSGVIPKVSYQHQNLNINGALQIKVFDGTTVIRDLKLESPLGNLPQLYANVDIHDLDLELLTRTFDFGRITGKLEGYVHDLRLSNWKPVQFDANFSTPEKHSGKRRISQKAVDNISKIGGGASGLLSRSFLGFFDDFSYSKIGISCHLHNETCDMSGIENTDDGYYIVKGGGLPPWINVVGYTRKVNWTDLLVRLQAVTNSSGPVIQ